MCSNKLGKIKRKQMKKIKTIAKNLFGASRLKMLAVMLLCCTIATYAQNAAGDYTNDELMRKGAIDAHILELPIYWNSSENYPIPVIGGVVTYDKTKEQYYIDSLSAIKPMS